MRNYETTVLCRDIAHSMHRPATRTLRAMPLEANPATQKATNAFLQASPGDPICRKSFLTSSPGELLGCKSFLAFPPLGLKATSPKVNKPNIKVAFESSFGGEAWHQVAVGSRFWEIHYHEVAFQVGLVRIPLRQSRFPRNITKTYQKANFRQSMRAC